MPFTPAHAALVLPLTRISPRYASATGLIIGSMAPDFEYFFRMSPDAEYGHTLAGLFYFDVPVTVLLAIVFHTIVKQRLLSNLPYFLQTRLQPLRQLDFTAYLKTHLPAFLLCAWLGAASHIFWDAFTHNDGYFVRHIDFYKHRYVPFQGVRYPLWYALQNISSWVGLAVLSIYVAVLKPQQGQVQQPSAGYWCFVLAVTALAVGVRFGFDVRQARIGHIIIAAISGLCLALVLAGILQNSRFKIQN